MSNHSTSTSIEKSLIEAFSDKPIAVILPVHLKLAGDYATAAALAQILYWRKTMNKEFYKKDIGADKDGVDRSWCAELMLTITQWKTVKQKLKQLPFLTIVTKGIPPMTYYDVDYLKLAAAIADFQPKKANKSNKTTFKATNDANSRDLPLIDSRDLPLIDSRDLPLNVSRDLPPYNTETTQLLPIHYNNGGCGGGEMIEKEPEQIPVIVEKTLQVTTNDVVTKLFTVKEQPAAKKLIGELPPETQSEVLEVIQYTQIKSSKIGLLRTLVKSAKEGTFTPLEPKSKPVTSEERLAKQKQSDLESQARSAAAAKANDAHLKQMEKEIKELGKALESPVHKDIPQAAAESLRAAKLALRGGRV